MRTLLVSGLSIVALLGAATGAETPKEPDRAKLEEMTRLQIFLDHANFGPGKIDGKGGEFTRKALERYRKAQGVAEQATVSAPDKKAESKKKESKGEQIDTSGLDLQSVGETFISYTVTREDLEELGEVPKEPAAQAKLKFLPYQTAWEGISEKFHADPDFLKELNPGVKPASLEEGDQLTVPNVKPFELATVKEIKPGEALKKDEPENTSAETAGSEEKKEESKKEESAEEKQNAKVTIHVDTGANMLEVRQGDQLLAAFPVTPGSNDIPTPVGEWKVKGVATMPDFRYDKKMLKEGVRGDETHLIPPGPNSPVGVIWIALNKPGIGIHGTDDPETIGRAASHGCIRLANWDAVKLARLVKGGVSVTIK